MTDRIETPAFTGTPRAASPFGPVRKWPKPAPAPKPLSAPRPPAAMSPADIAAHEASSYVRPSAAHRDDVPGLPPLPRPDAQDEDPNGPWLPKIPGPRKPKCVTPRPGDSDPNPDEALRRAQGRPPVRRSLAAAL